MFGRNGAKARPARSTRVDAAPRSVPDASAAPSTLLSIVGQQSRVEGKFAGPRAVHLVEDMRQGAQK